MDSSRGMDWFAPATSKYKSEQAVVLPMKPLTHDDTGSPGIFLFPGDLKNIDKPPYDLSFIKDRLMLKKKLVRYSFCPALESTIIPMDFQNIGKSRIRLEETTYLLQHSWGQEKLVGFRANVKLDFMIWHAKKWARRFKLDSAILLDPRFKHLLMNPDAQVCFLGMDFMTKHPHLIFVPEYDSRHELGFRLAKGLFVNRSYELSTNSWQEVVIHVDGHHNNETGNIGSGVFFKSRSIFNSFGGVSKCDAFGRKLESLWEERGILVAIVKALKIVEALPVGIGSTPEVVIIKTSSSEIEGMLAPIKWFATRIRPPYEDQSEQDLENTFPPAVRDVAMYYYHRFVQRQPGFKIKIQYAAKGEGSGGALAARLLAMAGAEMEEFRMNLGGNELKSRPLWGYHNTSGVQSSDIIPLESYFALRGSSIYVSFGIDGYFLIPRKKVYAVMAAADKAGLKLSVEDSVKRPENGTITMTSKFSGLGMSEFGPLYGNNCCPINNTAVGALKEPSKEKPKPRVDEHSQKCKVFEKGFPQSLSEFANDWNIEMNDITSDPGLEEAKLMQCGNVGYNPRPSKEALHSQDKIFLEKKEQIAAAQKKGLSELKAQKNIGTSQSDILKVLEMWKIKPELEKATKDSDAPEACEMDCVCRVTGMCKCTEGCKGKSACGRKTKEISESGRVGVEKVVEGPGAIPCLPNKLESMGIYVDSTEANHIQMLAESKTQARVKFERFPTEGGKSRLSDPAMPIDDYLRPILKHTDKGKAETEEKKLEANANAGPVGVVCYKDSRTVEQLMEHKMRLMGHEKELKLCGVPYPYDSYPKKLVHSGPKRRLTAMKYTEMGKFPKGQIPGACKFSWEKEPGERKRLEEYKFPGDQGLPELSKRTQAMRRARALPASEREEELNEIYKMMIQDSLDSRLRRTAGCCY